MAQKLTLEMVTPYGLVLAEEVDMIVASGTLGEFAVLPGHAMLLTSLKIGELTYVQDGKPFYLSLNQGHFELVDDKVTILVETAERAEEIDLERAKAALGRAEAALLKSSRDDSDFILQEAALKRALIRMQVAAKAARK